MRRLPDDPHIRELLPGFCEDWREALAESTWPRLLARRDRGGLHHLGHTVKGSFGQFGLPDGAAHGDLLIASARADDWEGAGRHVAALLALVLALRDELQSRPD